MNVCVYVSKGHRVGLEGRADKRDGAEGHVGRRGGAEGLLGSGKAAPKVAGKRNNKIKLCWRRVLLKPSSLEVNKIKWEWDQGVVFLQLNGGLFTCHPKLCWGA